MRPSEKLKLWILLQLQLFPVKSSGLEVHRITVAARSILILRTTSIFIMNQVRNINLLALKIGIYSIEFSQLLNAICLKYCSIVVTIVPKYWQLFEL